MKTNNSVPLSPIEVCTLMAHETVALLDAADDSSLDAAAEFREALKVFSAAQGLGEDGDTLLAWVDAEIKSAKQFAAGGGDSPRVIDPDRLLPVPNAAAQLDAVWALFETAADECETGSRQSLLNAARMLTDMGGLSDLLLTAKQPSKVLSAAMLQSELADVRTALQTAMEPSVECAAQIEPMVYGPARARQRAVP